MVSLSNWLLVKIPRVLQTFSGEESTKTQIPKGSSCVHRVANHEHSAHDFISTLYLLYLHLVSTLSQTPQPLDLHT